MRPDRSATISASVSSTTSEASEPQLPLPRRGRHVAFAGPDTDDEDETASEAKPSSTVEVEIPLDDDDAYYYADGPNQEPIIHPIIKYTNHNNHQEQLSPRRKSMQIMSKYMDDHESNFTFENQEGMGLFGPKISLDTRKMQRNLFNQKRPSVFQHVARFHHKFGIRHYILVGLLALYSAGGGLLFLKLEAENELQNLEATRHVLQNMIEKLSEEVFEISNVTVPPSVREDVILLIGEYYREMLKAEGKYAGSVFHKYERINMRLTWSYGSAVFYAMTLFTTIGYGTIATQTTIGKIMAVIYATIGIPLMLVVLSDVGRVLLRWFTLAYNVVRRAILRVIRLIFKFALHRNFDRDTDYEAQEFPLYLSIPLVVGYLGLCAIFVNVFDYHDGITPGLSLGDAFYFSFISMTTIGLGDVMPNNIEYSPVLAIMFLFGLSLLSVVNSTVYEKMERRFLHAVDVLEAWLENIHFYRHGNEGYHVFKLLGPNIQLLALALPLFDDNAEEEIGNMLKPHKTALGIKMFSRPRTRTNSLDERIQNFQPTLGILGRRVSSEGATRTRARTLSLVPPIISRGSVGLTRTKTSAMPVPNLKQVKEDVPMRSPETVVRRVQSDRQKRQRSESGHVQSVPRLRAISEIV